MHDERRRLLWRRMGSLSAFLHFTARSEQRVERLSLRAWYTPARRLCSLPWGKLAQTVSTDHFQAASASFRQNGEQSACGAQEQRAPERRNYVFVVFFHLLLDGAHQIALRCAGLVDKGRAQARSARGARKRRFLFFEMSSEALRQARRRGVGEAAVPRKAGLTLCAGRCERSDSYISRTSSMPFFPKVAIFPSKNQTS